MDPYLFKNGLRTDLGDFIVDPKLTMTTGSLSKSNTMHKTIQTTTFSTNNQAFTQYFGRIQFSVHDFQWGFWF